MTALLPPLRFAVGTTEIRIPIPTGAKVVQLVLQLGVAVQLSLEQGQSNTAGKFFTIPANVTAITWDIPEGYTGSDLWAYAASTVNVDLVVLA